MSSPERTELPAEDFAQLCDAMLNGELTPPEVERLQQQINSDPAARQQYLERCEIHALLLWEHGTLGGQRELVLPQSNSHAKPVSIWRQRLWRASLAALIAFAFSILAMQALRDRSDAGLGSDTPDVSEEVVATLTGSKDAKWAVDAAYVPGQAFRSRQNIQLVQGLAEVTFASGARITLEGPASFDTNSAWDGHLRSGLLRASIPAQATGFRVSAPDVEIGQGTDFAMEADASGATDVFVLSGEAEALSRGEKTAPRNRAVLRDKDSRRFSNDGIGNVKDPERRRARLSRLLSATLDREKLAGATLRWSFDSVGAQTPATVNGEFSDALALQFVPKQGEGATAIEGRWKGAVHLDGNTIARVQVPGLSTHAPKTVAIWLRQPEIGNVRDGSGLIAWQLPDGAKSGVRIGINTRSDQGVLGALRTDFGKGFVVGATPLEPGKWHHIAVVFIPHKNVGEPVHVLQYVDGRLEGMSSSRGKMRKAVTASEETDVDAPNTLWLGRGRGSTQEKFTGDLDEFLLIQRALTPQEILQLMQENR